MSLLDHLKTKQTLIDENRKLTAMVEEAIRNRMLGSGWERLLEGQLQTKFQCVHGSAVLLEVDTGRHVSISAGDNLDIRFSGLKLA